MNYVALIVAGLLAAMIGGSALATLTRRQSIVDLAREVGFPTEHLWVLGTVKLAAAAGLCLGLLWWPLGVAAAVGLIAYFTAAVDMHIRTRQRDVAAPIVFLVLATVVSILLVSVNT
ncbi:DoxX family protein [Nocardia lasii]|uniref:DoxX family protein n=1 Tax=Nocardia lasii TaxID=1616107 RepID=A0ABW1JQF9_9NOCA